MKGNEKMIEHLNRLLAEELTAINQYMVHAEMADNWGYTRLHKQIEDRAMAEMRHAEKIIARIIFLEGRPTVNPPLTINIGAEVPKMHQNDRMLEEGAVRGYNDSIRLAVEIGDNGSRELLEAILAEEEQHLDELEAQLDEISQMGAQLYLAAQIK